ncbi:hypothetical protein PPTG_22740 [Phytophthora nicotianae INRA-310]|uniref:Ubiquitin-like protease family profile domain-containing protein n=1 Tax=Phytophthora nicotianae (strain INRA-310) TaxID=761204 RepID=W2QD35_PHYN3|nr:hypothetical protein PPTG_22740 [Phytophthora nicotianae INRA-310]ETN10429.1 hypothetical protein PPTG_22740 [Phytophthora nicotianae INRA-310]
MRLVKGRSKVCMLYNQRLPRYQLRRAPYNLRWANFPAEQHVEIGQQLLLADDEFDIDPPPKSRGRPKTKAAVVKSKRNQAITMTNDDSELHNMGLSIKTIAEILAKIPTFISAAERLRKFRIFVFTKKPKSPIAWELSVGVFTTETLKVMKEYHRATAAVRLVERAVTWISTINFKLPVYKHFQVLEDSDMGAKLKQLPLLSHEMGVLDLAAKGSLGDEIMTTVMTKLFSANPILNVASPHMISVPVNGKIWTDNQALVTLFFGAPTGKFLIPVNCNQNHWCSIMVGIGEKKKLYYYDPMGSSYKNGVRLAAQVVKQLITDQLLDGCRAQSYGSHLGIQTDSYTCGIYVLLAFELFAGAPSPGILGKKTLQYLRYRYLHMCI